MALELPTEVRGLLHDCDPDRVSWESHPEFLIDRILSEGSWDTVRWLRRTAGDETLRARVVATRGRRLSARQLRFWQVLLDLPHGDVTRWLADPARAIWDRRSA
jgi:hypothetical protein